MSASTLFWRSLLIANVIIGLELCASQEIKATPMPSAKKSDESDKCGSDFMIPQFYILIGLVVYCVIVLFGCVFFIVVYRAHMRFMFRKIVGLDRPKKHKAGKDKDKADKKGSKSAKEKGKSKRDKKSSKKGSKK